MSITDILNASGLLCSIIGSILLTISLSKYLTSMHGALAIHDMQIQSLVNRDNKILSGDVGKLLREGVQDSRIKTIAGLIMVVAGFILQAIPFVIVLLSKK